MTKYSIIDTSQLYSTTFLLYISVFYVIIIVGWAEFVQQVPWKRCEGVRNPYISSVRKAY